MSTIVIVERDLYAKISINWASVSRVTKICLCCHGNKSSIATRYAKDL